MFFKDHTLPQAWGQLMGQKSALIAGLGLVLLALFAWLPFSYYRMVQWPLILLWQVGFLLWGGWVILQLRRFKQPFLPLGHGLDGMVGITLVGIVLSSLAAPFRGVALWNVVLVLGYGLVLYGLRNGIKLEGSSVRQVWWSVAAMAIANAGLSLAYWRPSADMWQAGNFASAIRNAQPLGHHNFEGGYLVLSLPLVVALALAEQGWQRWLASGGALLIAIATYISGSRGAALGLIVWLTLTLALRIFTHSGKHRRRQGIVSAAILVLALGAMASNPRIRTTVQVILGGQGLDLSRLSAADSPLIDRLFMAQAGLNIFGDRPWLGAGPGNISRLFNLYRPIDMGTGLDHVQQLHNTPIHLLAELGIVGIGLYLAWGIWVGRLWWRLARQLPPGRDGRRPVPKDHRTLLMGISGSFCAYGVSSLTDYQLENIPIALTLITNLILMACLADTLAPPPPLSALFRRCTSLATLALLALCLQVWLPFNFALALGQQAVIATDQRQDLPTAHRKWLKASQLIPWDPTYSALAAQQLVLIEQGISLPDDQAAIREGVIENLVAAYQAAPYDAWFNNNLAIRLLPEAADQAEVFAIRTVELLPRTQNYTYYILGLTYLAQQKTAAAITAFALEGLVTPRFSTLPIWQIEPLRSIYPDVVAQTLDLYDALLANLSPDQSPYPILYEQAQLLRWWHQRPPLPDLDMGQPVIRALIQADQNPAAALALLNEAIAVEPQNIGLQMLRAWIDPDTYLDEVIALSNDGQETEALRAHLRAHRQARAWITSLTERKGIRQRQGLTFAYRNWGANAIDMILPPAPLEFYALAELLAVYREWPREFPALDQLVETVKADQLGLVHPTRNGYQLPTPDLSQLS
ncbi:MAG: O-antigen ligase family protein [Leptolyngbya sp. RL_3_1]|nr:O-antigen ligase family protein [Leptolyngbya sp. RL_3_1]